MLVEFLNHVNTAQPFGNIQCLVRLFLRDVALRNALERRDLPGFVILAN